MNDLTRNITGISALDDDVRRELYHYVASQPTPVSRDQTAQALGIPRHQAKFHLDRLEAAGLLESDHVRLTGRSGPGAGRPAKVYSRKPDEISVSLPGREYALAGELMATAIDEAASLGTPVTEALMRAARTRGTEIGAGTVRSGTALQVAAATVRGLGYEPRMEADRLVMANCPFHTLAKKHTQLVCSMNHSLLTGICDQIGGIEAALEPAAERCCVILLTHG